MKSLLIAFAMYSKIPVPQTDWEKRALSKAMCWLPLVGVVMALVLAAWLKAAAFLQLSPFLTGTVAMLVPVALSGGIHLDGLCDTADALASNQSRERKLEILKDSHTGAFAIILCGIYLLLSAALWTEADHNAWLVLALIPAVSRCAAGQLVVTMPNARGSGLLATFIEPMDGKVARVVMVLWCLGALVALLAADLVLGACAAAGALLCRIWFVHLAKKQFGGLTGDLAGCFLQLCETACVAAVVLGQKIGGVL